MRPLPPALRRILVLAATVITLLIVLAGCAVPAAPAPDPGQTVVEPTTVPEEPTVAPMEEPTVAPPEEPTEEPTEEPIAETITATVAPPPPMIVTDDADLCTSLVDLNLEHTSEALDTATFWTWHVNFKSAEGIFDGADFYGCLHFFVRVDGSQVFTPTSLYLLTPCYFVDVDGGVVPPTNAELAWTSDGSKQIDAMRATFDGKGYLSCPVNLIEGGFAVASDTRFDNNLIDIASIQGWDAGDLITNTHNELPDPVGATPDQLYEMLSMVGASQPLIRDELLEAVQNDAAPFPTHPLLYYAPDCTGTTGGCPNPVSHALFLLPNGSIDEFSLGGRLERAFYRPGVGGICESEPDVCLLPLRPFPAWYSTVDLGDTLPTYTWPSVSMPCIDEAQLHTPAWENYLMLGGVPMTDVVSAPNWDIWCTSEIEPALDGSDGGADLQAGVPFWLGNATIFVGYDPEAESLFEGDMWEVWLDPENSGTKSRSNGE